MNYVQFDSLHGMEFAVEGNAFHIEQSAQQLDRLAHCGQRFPPLNTDVFGKWVPPGADSTDHTPGGQVVQGQEGGGQ